MPAVPLFLNIHKILSDSYTGSRAPIFLFFSKISDETFGNIKHLYYLCIVHKMCIREDIIDNNSSTLIYITQVYIFVDIIYCRPYYPKAQLPRDDRLQEK